MTSTLRAFYENASNNPHLYEMRSHPRDIIMQMQSAKSASETPLCKCWQWLKKSDVFASGRRTIIAHIGMTTTLENNGCTRRVTYHSKASPRKEGARNIAKSTTRRLLIKFLIQLFWCEQPSILSNCTRRLCFLAQFSPYRNSSRATSDYANFLIFILAIKHGLLPFTSD
jgi:hypothetical protein